MARGIHCCPKSCLFLLPHHRLYTVQNMCIYTQTDCIWITVKHFYTDRSGAKCWLDIYRWGAGLAVLGQYWTLGQNVLLSAFEQEAAAALLLPCFVTYCISWGGLYWRYNTVIILQTNYIIIIGTCINNIAVIDNNYGRLQDLILLFKIPGPRTTKDNHWPLGW